MMKGYDKFERMIIAVIGIVTLLGFYYAKIIYTMAQNLVYEPNVILGVLLFIILEVMLLNAVLLYSMVKGEKE